MSTLRYLPFALLVPLLALLLAGCGTATSEAQGEPDAAAPGNPGNGARAASETLAGMLELAEAGDWGGYVDQHYGEAHKFRGPDDRDALVWRFEERWGAKVVEALRRAAAVTPTLESDRALFLENDDPIFILHREADGRWTFHL